MEAGPVAVHLGSGSFGKGIVASTHDGLGVFDLTGGGIGNHVGIGVAIDLDAQR